MIIYKESSICTKPESLVQGYATLFRSNLKPSSDFGHQINFNYIGSNKNMEIKKKLYTNPNQKDIQSLVFKYASKIIRFETCAALNVKKLSKVIPFYGIILISIIET